MPVTVASKWLQNHWTEPANLNDATTLWLSTVKVSIVAHYSIINIQFVFKGVFVTRKNEFQTDLAIKKAMLKKYVSVIGK